MLSDRFCAPRDALELQLVQIWEDLLERRPVGVNEDFFELGGDSLLAMSLLARVSQETGYSLPMSGIFPRAHHQKLRALAKGSLPRIACSSCQSSRRGRSGRSSACIPAAETCSVTWVCRSGWARSGLFTVFNAGVFDGVLEPLQSVEKMAREYVAAGARFSHTAPMPSAAGRWGECWRTKCRNSSPRRASAAPLVILDSGVLYACVILTAIFPKGEMGALSLLRMASEEQVAEFRRRVARD